MHEVALVQAMSDWFDSERASLASRGTTVTFGRSPEDRPKTSSWLVVERGGRLGSLQIWSSGEAELEIGREGRVDVQEHHEIGESPHLAALIRRLLLLVGDEPG